jgi:hypothetical protein
VQSRKGYSDTETYKMGSRALRVGGRQVPKDNDPIPFVQVKRRVTWKALKALTG